MDYHQNARLTIHSREQLEHFHLYCVVPRRSLNQASALSGVI